MLSTRASYSVSILHLLQELRNAYYCSANSPATDLAAVIPGRHAQSIEASVKGFECSLGANLRADPTGCPMFNMDRCTDCDFVALTIRMQRHERRDLHQPDHVRSGIKWRQLRMMRRQRVLKFHGFFRCSAHADGNFFGHATLPKKKANDSPNHRLVSSCLCILCVYDFRTLTRLRFLSVLPQSHPTLATALWPHSLRPPTPSLPSRDGFPASSPIAVSTRANGICQPTCAA